VVYGRDRAPLILLIDADIDIDGQRHTAQRPRRLQRQSRSFSRRANGLQTSAK
jgi:hypothetical protein